MDKDKFCLVQTLNGKPIMFVVKNYNQGGYTSLSWRFIEDNPAFSHPEIAYWRSLATYNLENGVQAKQIVDNKMKLQSFLIPSKFIF